jgi:hypothetical protein
MSALRDFLSWFEGFSENLEKAPNAKQWEKVKERILALKDAPEATAAAPVRLPAPPGNGAAEHPARALPADVDPDPRGTTVVAKWREKVRQGLLEVYDERDATEELAKIPVDLNSTPEEAVARFLNGSA